MRDSSVNDIHKTQWGHFQFSAIIEEDLINVIKDPINTTGIDNIQMF